MTAEGATVTVDSAHNVWAKFAGETEEAVIIGSHLDSVPDGGWLDGALGVVAGMGIGKRYGIHDDLVVVLTEASYEAERRITEELYAYLTSRVKKVCISIGAAVSHITELSCSYAQAHTIVHLACKKGKHIFFYEELGIYKLLLEGNNPALLQDYYNEVLGALETHDAMADRLSVFVGNSVNFSLMLAFFAYKNNGALISPQIQSVVALAVL